ncbi:MAG: condensation domain-containing protein, partial [Crocinitomicaceae bacterium]
EKASLNYWNQYLDGYSESAEIPFKLEEEGAYVESNEHIKIEGEVFEKIDSLCSSLGITMNTFIQTVWGYLLAQYNGRQDVVFGAVVSGRPGELEGVEDMIGLFNNTIPIRVKYDEEGTPEELLKTMHQQSIQSSEHHYVSLAQVQSQSELKSNLIDHIMVFENYVVKELETEGELNSQGEDGLKIESITYFDQTNYNFNLTVYPGSTYVHINIRFNSNYYDTTLIQRIKNHLEMVVERFIDNANTPLNA